MKAHAVTTIDKATDEQQITANKGSGSSLVKRQPTYQHQREEHTADDTNNKVTSSTPS